MTITLCCRVSPCVHLNFSAVPAGPLTEESESLELRMPQSGLSLLLKKGIPCSARLPGNRSAETVIRDMKCDGNDLVLCLDKVDSTQKGG